MGYSDFLLTVHDERPTTTFEGAVRSPSAASRLKVLVAEAAEHVLGLPGTNFSCDSSALRLPASSAGPWRSSTSWARSHTSSSKSASPKRTSHRSAMASRSRGSHQHALFRAFIRTPPPSASLRSPQSTPPSSPTSRTPPQSAPPFLAVLAIHATPSRGYDVLRRSSCTVH
jgi:hypothetical protein